MDKSRNCVKMASSDFRKCLTIDSFCNDKFNVQEENIKSCLISGSAAGS